MINHIPKLLKNLTKTKIALLGAAAVVLASGGTALAAQSSKPGDLLYGVKLTSENLRVDLAFTSGMKKSAELSMANQRISEIQQLLAEKGVSAPGIQVALANLTKSKDELSKLATTQKDATAAKEIETETSDLQNQVDGVFEAQQKAIEVQREALQQQYEAATKKGDTAAAATLKQQINAIEPQLKNLETTRESAKHQLETTQQSDGQQSDQPDQQQSTDSQTDN